MTHTYSEIQLSHKNEQTTDNVTTWLNLNNMLSQRSQYKRLHTVWRGHLGPRSRADWRDKRNLSDMLEQAKQIYGGTQSNGCLWERGGSGDD